jgi:AraC-like DNA-binding protein
LNLHSVISDLDVVRRSNTKRHARRAERSRHVRISYPAALVELALLLCATMGKRQAASALGVGMSTVYRWVDTNRTAWIPRETLRTDGPAADTADVISALSARCEHAGFHVSRSLVNRDVSPVPSGYGSIVGSHGIGEVHRISAIEEVVLNYVEAAEPMARVKQEIETKYATRLTCQRLASVANMPRIQLIREFSSTFGVPPYQYLLGIRVKRAMDLLQYSSASLSIVAATTGFGSTSSMQRAFKRFAGGSPGTVVKAIAPRRGFAFANSIDSHVLSTNKS